MVRLTDQVQAIWTEFLQPGDAAIDATCGNGHDIVVLARIVGPCGHVYAIDRQAAAINSSRQRVAREGLLPWVSFHHEDHALLDPGMFNRSPRPRIAVLNLGYLPHGDHSLITRPESTLACLHILHAVLVAGSLISVIAYTGHPGGKEELRAVEDWISEATATLDQRIETNANGPTAFLLRT